MSYEALKDFRKEVGTKCALISIIVGVASATAVHFYWQSRIISQNDTENETIVNLNAEIGILHANIGRLNVDMTRLSTENEIYLENIQELKEEIRIKDESIQVLKSENQDLIGQINHPSLVAAQCAQYDGVIRGIENERTHLNSKLNWASGETLAQTHQEIAANISGRRCCSTIRTFLGSLSLIRPQGKSWMQDFSAS